MIQSKIILFFCLIGGCNGTMYSSAYDGGDSPQSQSQGLQVHKVSHQNKLVIQNIVGKVIQESSALSNTDTIHPMLTCMPFWIGGESDFDRGCNLIEFDKSLRENYAVELSRVSNSQRGIITINVYDALKKWTQGTLKRAQDNS